MSDRIITLDGLPNKHVGGQSCGKLVSVKSGVIGESYKVCETDLSRVEASGLALGAVKRRRGRPKGSTVAKGARRPKVAVCKHVAKIKTRRGTRCRCTDSSNKMFVKCGTTPH